MKLICQIQDSEANEILFQSTYGSLQTKLNLTHKPQKCPQPPTGIVHLRKCNKTDFVWELKQGFMKVAVSGAVGLRECLDSLHCISKQKNEQIIIMVARITRAVQCKYMYV